MASWFGCDSGDFTWSETKRVTSEPKNLWAKQPWERLPFVFLKSSCLRNFICASSRMCSFETPAGLDFSTHFRNEWRYTMPGFRFAYMGSTAACDVFPGRHRERCLRTWQGDLKTLCSWMDPVLSFLLPWPYISAHFWLHLVYPFSNWYKYLRYSRIRRKHYHNRNHRSLKNTYPIFLTWNWAGIVAYRGNRRFQYASSSLSVGWMWCPDLPPPNRTTDQHMLGSLTAHQLLHTPSLRSPKN